MATQQIDGTATATAESPARRRGALALVALAVLGLLLYCVVFAVLLGLELQWQVSSDVWFSLAAYGSLGFFPAAVGLALGVIALVLARRRGERNPTARWAVVLAGGVLAVMASLIVGWWLFVGFS